MSARERTAEPDRGRLVHRAPDPLDSLEADLETSLADVEALRQAAAHRPADPFAAVQELIDALPPAARRPSRKTASGRPELVL